MVLQPPFGHGLLIIEALQLHSLGHSILGRTLLDESSARSRDLYLTRHNIHKREIFMQPMRFEPAIPASEGPQTNVLDHDWDRLYIDVPFFN